MIRFPLASLVLIVGISGAVASVQNLPTRDPQAVATLQQAIAALGGSDAASSVQDATVTGSIQPVSGNTIPPSSFTWKIAGQEFRVEDTAGGATTVFVSGHGNPAVKIGATIVPATKADSQANAPFYIPSVLLNRELADANYALATIGPDTVGGIAAIHVHTASIDSTTSTEVNPQEWYFDSSTNVPLRVQYCIPAVNDDGGCQSVTLDLSGWQPVSGVLVPFVLTISVDGVMVATDNISSVIFNSGLLPSEFDLPLFLSAGGAL